MNARKSVEDIIIETFSFARSLLDAPQGKQRFVSGGTNSLPFLEQEVP